MKNLLKLKAMLRIAGFIAMVAVIGFGLVGCDDEDDGNGVLTGEYWGAWYSVTGRIIGDDGANYIVNGTTGILEITVSVYRYNTPDGYMTAAQKAEAEAAIKKLTKANISVDPLTDVTRTLTIGNPVTGPVPGWGDMNAVDGWSEAYESSGVYYYYFIEIERSELPANYNARKQSSVTVTYPATAGFNWIQSQNLGIWW